MRYAYAFLGVGILVIGAVAFFITQGGAPSIYMSDTPGSILALSSPAFPDGGSIPSQYTCDSASPISPPLTISGVPEGTVSLVLLMDDPDVPKALKPDGVFDHWVMYAIPPETREIPEGMAPGTEGLNGAEKAAYAGPCPPSQYEPREHRYFFKLYALSGTLTFVAPPTKAEVLIAMQGIIIGEVALIGKYQRK